MDLALFCFGGYRLPLHSSLPIALRAPVPSSAPFFVSSSYFHLRRSSVRFFGFPEILVAPSCLVRDLPDLRPVRLLAPPPSGNETPPARSPSVIYDSPIMSVLDAHARPAHQWLRPSCFHAPGSEYLSRPYQPAYVDSFPPFRRYKFPTPSNDISTQELSVFPTER